MLVLLPVFVKAQFALIVLTAIMQAEHLRKWRCLFS